MTRSRFFSFQTALAGLLLVPFFLSPVKAAEGEHLTVDINIGGSELVEIREPGRSMKILVSNEEIIGARPLRSNLINIFSTGKKTGYSRITVFDESRGRALTIIDVNVSLNIMPLKQKIHQLYPNEKVEVYSSESGIVLSGTVSGPEVMDRILRLARTFLPPGVGGMNSHSPGGKSGDGITNLMNVGGIQQVLLEVKFAEVNRTSSRNWQAALGLTGLGSTFTGAAGTQPLPTNPDATGLRQRITTVTEGGTVVSELVPVAGLVQEAGSLLLNFAGNPANIFLNIEDFTAALHFLEDEGLARILAEPKLITQSGQEASFLAGGEFPIPVPQDNNTVTIAYKEFGVGLRFTPVVLSDGKISLRVAPSVSDIASSSIIPSGIVGAEFVVPNLTSRKLETTVQLYDGQTLALAGLLQDSLRETVSKVPGLGDLPIIGALFRSSAYLQEKTDLLIAVTPHLVMANKEDTIRFPGENLNPPNRFEFYLEGRLEGRRAPGEPSALSRHSFNPTISPGLPQGGLEGVFGQESIFME
ncbi:MAG: type II and III secretion system protein family protein [Syntrophotaleaceae bacterium]